MAIINYRINRIEGRRTDEEAKNVDVKSSFVILSVKRDNNPTIGDFLRVNFSFEVEYEPDLGSMKIEGNLWYHEPDLDKLMTEKKGKIKLEPRVIKEVTSSIVRDSLLEMVELSRKLRLPVPIRLPRLNIEPTKREFKKAS
ncbi:MAG: hypothetical protein B6U86_00125 [Candidatus Altiarchaeales archaeon ex4484_43]|nr:MAG: hypothetical protein B6U86_00125 [Candidatus Altiarchaeales archaeon ex4484_43]